MRELWNTLYFTSHFLASGAGAVEKPSGECRCREERSVNGHCCNSGFVCSASRVTVLSVRASIQSLRICRCLIRILFAARRAQKISASLNLGNTGGRSLTSRASSAASIDGCSWMPPPAAIIVFWSCRTVLSARSPITSLSQVQCARAPRAAGLETTVVTICLPSHTTAKIYTVSLIKVFLSWHQVPWHCVLTKISNVRAYAMGAIRGCGASMWQQPHCCALQIARNFYIGSSQQQGLVSQNLKSYHFADCYQLSKQINFLLNHFAILWELCTILYYII